MYTAVEIYKKKQSVIGILFCVPVFILSGFEHSIADIYYFTTTNIINLNSFIFILIVIIGNAIGANLHIKNKERKYLKF